MKYMYEYKRQKEKHVFNLSFYDDGEKTKYWHEKLASSAAFPCSSFKSPFNSCSLANDYLVKVIKIWCLFIMLFYTFHKNNSWKLIIFIHVQIMLQQLNHLNNVLSNGLLTYVCIWVCVVFSDYLFLLLRWQAILYSK